MRRLAALFLAAALAGCGSGSSSAPAGEQSVEQFVRDQVAATSDTADPVDINDIDFDDRLLAGTLDDLLQ